MLSRSQRLDRKSFEKICRSPVVARGLGFSVRASVNKKASQSRFSVVVPKNVAQTAVQRNRLRRQLYAIFETTNIENPTDFIFYVGKGFPKKREVFHFVISNTLAKLNSQHPLK